MNDRTQSVVARSTNSKRCVAALAVALAAFGLAGCPSGLGHGTTAQSTQSEGAAASASFTGLDLGVKLVDPTNGLPTQVADVQSLAVAVQGHGAVIFYAFTTTARADDADGAGHALDPEAPSDTNGAQDVFLTAIDAGGGGAVLDTVLVSRRNPTVTPIALASGSGASLHPRIVYSTNPRFGTLGDDENDTLAGRVYVVFESDAADLVAGDLNGHRDVFQAVVYVEVGEDPATGLDAPKKFNLRTAPKFLNQPTAPKYMTRMVSYTEVSANGGGNADSSNASLGLWQTGDGNADPADVLLIAFESKATDVLAGFGDGNASASDVFRLYLTPPQSTLHPSPDPVCSNCHNYPQGGHALLSSRTSSATGGGNAGSFRPTVAVDANGNSVYAFESDASNLVAGDTNAARDVFYRIEDDTAALGSVERASVATGGVQALGASRNANVHIVDAPSDSLLVAFESDATNLAAQLPPNSTTNAYLRDTHRDRTTLLNQRIGPNGAIPGSAGGGAKPADSFAPSIAPDGNSVAFTTRADDLDVFAPHDKNGFADVVVAELDYLFTSGHLRHHRVSIAANSKDANGASSSPSFGTFQGSVGVTLAPNGQPEAFSEALANKFVFPRCIICHGFNANPSTRPPSHPTSTDCVSCHTPELTGVANWHAPGPELDFRNLTVAELCAHAKTPLPGLTPEQHLKNDDRIIWALTSGAIPDNGPSNGVSRDTMPGGQAEWNAQVDAWSQNGYQCQDLGASGGAFVGFDTAATNLGLPTASDHAVAFLSHAKVERVSKTSGWAPNGGKQLDASSRNASLTRDDRYVAFETDAALDPNDTNGTTDVYVRDTFLGTTTLVSHAAGKNGSANRASRRPSATVDPTNGTLYVAFESLATNLVSGFVDHNGAAASDVFVAKFAAFDGVHSASIAIELVSGSSASATDGGNAQSLHASAGSPSGSVFVAFESLATDVTTTPFTDSNGPSAADVFRWSDNSGSFTELMSCTAADPNVGADGESRNPKCSAQGFWVAFESLADDLTFAFVDGNGPSAPDVFVSLGSGFTSLASSTDGVHGGNGASFDASLGDGPDFVVYSSTSTDLVGGFVDHNGAAPDVFITDSNLGTIELASGSSSTDGGDGASDHPDVSIDGNLVVFDSLATNLIGSDTNKGSDVFLHDRTAGQTVRMSRSVTNAQASKGSTKPSLGSNAGRVAFESTADDLIGANVDTNQKSDVFRAER